MGDTKNIPAHRILYTNVMEPYVAEKIRKMYQLKSIDDQRIIRAFKSWMDMLEHDLRCCIQSGGPPVIYKITEEFYRDASRKPGDIKGTQEFYGEESRLGAPALRNLTKPCKRENHLWVYDENGRFIIEAVRKDNPLKKTIFEYKMVDKQPSCYIPKSTAELFEGNEWVRVPRIYNIMNGGPKYRYVKRGERQNVYKFEPYLW